MVLTIINFKVPKNSGVVGPAVYKILLDIQCITWFFNYFIIIVFKAIIGLMYFIKFRGFFPFYPRFFSFDDFIKKVKQVAFFFRMKKQTYKGAKKDYKMKIKTYIIFFQ